MKTILVVLGHMTEALRKTRVQRAVRYLEEYPYKVAGIVFSGWNGEAEAMSHLAFPAGPDSVAFWVACETRSQHTLENAAYTAELLAARGYDPMETEIVIVTNPFHALRAHLSFRRFFPRVEIAEAAEGIPADQPNLIREELWKIAAYNARGHIFPGSVVRDLFAQIVTIVP